MSVQHVFGGRLRAIALLAVAFVVFNALVRLVLAAWTASWDVLGPARLVPSLAIGATFDLAVVGVALIPITMLVAGWPLRRERALRWTLTTLLLPLTLLMVAVGFCEAVFWNEFTSRFNFIAVDYLVYTNEVLGNIRQSYNLPVLLTALAIATLAIWWPLQRQVARSMSSARPARHALAAWIIVPAMLMTGMSAELKEFSADARANELAGNGYFDFWHAFRYNEIDYAKLYRTLPIGEATQTLARELDTSESDLHRILARKITPDHAPRHLNVVLVSIESFSAEFMGVFGSTESLTPRLDRLAGEGLLFTRLHATGTRTVRGLEALTLSIPPTPGHSIVKRPNNTNLFTLGGVFKDHGYEPLYIYGGYSYFDNMRAFFGGNGYTVIDRSALAKDEVSYENVWGVADEDLFRLALRELDRRAAAGVPFFAHIMTTSNHRPYTYPEGRIDIPSKTGREGAVKYSDYALGAFIDAARTRPWFAETLFVLTADHTHKGRGRAELALEDFHIPMIFYAPDHVAPGRIDTLASQIDVAPTILGWLGLGYESRFFGHDILRDGARHPRALIANYQTVGYAGNDTLVELKPNARSRIRGGSEQTLEQAISYYQLASYAFKANLLRRDGPHR